MFITINTNKDRQIIDITDQIEKQLNGDGLVTIFVKHTTAAITTADLDPGTDQDLLDAIAALTPNLQWRHPHNPNHFPDHLWASVIGSSLQIPFTNGRLSLGTWQRVVLVELSGPKQRNIELTLSSL